MRRYPSSKVRSSGCTSLDLFEGKPVDEGTTRRGTDTRVHRPEKPDGAGEQSAERDLCGTRQAHRREFHLGLPEAAYVETCDPRGL